jgi:hypothetical protein
VTVSSATWGFSSSSSISMAGGISFSSHSRDYSLSTHFVESTLFSGYPAVTIQGVSNFSNMACVMKVFMLKYNMTQLPRPEHFPILHRKRRADVFP